MSSNVDIHRRSVGKHRSRAPRTVSALVPRLCAALALAALAGSCGGKSTPMAPSGGGGSAQVTVSGIQPSSGPTIGGTVVTVSGTNFALGMELVINGRPAENVAVVSQTTLQATAPASAPGTYDVTVNDTTGTTSTLPGAYTFVPVQNAPPVIASITALGLTPRAPSSYINVGDSVRLTAVVTDPDAGAGDLTYEWSEGLALNGFGGFGAPGGRPIFSGTGPILDWIAPLSLGQAPAQYAITLKVSEQYEDVDASGNLVTRTNETTSSLGVVVHDSVRELNELVITFLEDFSDSSVPAATAVRNFSNICGGKPAELADVQANRDNFIINSHHLGTPTTTVNFGGVCAFRGRPADGCTRVNCGWESTIRSSGAPDSASGLCYLASVFENNQWRLCYSDYDSLVGFSNFSF